MKHNCNYCQGHTDYKVMQKKVSKGQDLTINSEIVSDRYHDWSKLSKEEAQEFCDKWNDNIGFQWFKADVAYLYYIEDII